jgi:hypothetical protein
MLCPDTPISALGSDQHRRVVDDRLHGAGFFFRWRFGRAVFRLRRWRAASSSSSIKRPELDGRASSWHGDHTTTVVWFARSLGAFE